MRAVCTLLRQVRERGDMEIAGLGGSYLSSCRLRSKASLGRLEEGPDICIAPITGSFYDHIIERKNEKRELQIPDGSLGYDPVECATNVTGTE